MNPISNVHLLVKHTVLDSKSWAKAVQQKNSNVQSNICLQDLKCKQYFGLHRRFPTTYGLRLHCCFFPTNDAIFRSVLGYGQCTPISFRFSRQFIVGRYHQCEQTLFFRHDQVKIWFTPKIQKITTSQLVEPHQPVDQSGF